MKIIKKILFLISFLFIVLLVYYFDPENNLPKSTKVDSIVVYKSKRIMQIYSDGRLLKTYTIALGRNPIGAKEFEGDRKTPEGVYYINDKNPNSGWHKNLGISYPNATDRKRAKQMGKSPGGAIKIHGLKNKRGFVGKFHRWKDWTLGCIAVTDDEVDELYRTVKIGTPIEIKP
jgi:murein L,D-transpeptidase YafK